MGSKLKDLTGRKNGLLTVSHVVETDGTVDGTTWEASCYCGGSILLNHKVITGKKKKNCGSGTFKVRLNNLTSGNTTSCGCQQGMHKMSNTRTYRIWEGMKRRCNPSLADDFPYHAGKGITYCESWEKFENFYRDMGDAPDSLSLDRIDGYNKGVDPNNTSGRTGVSFYSACGKWSAEIHVNNKHIRLGMFSDFEDAVNAREKAELKYYGWNKE